MKNIHRSAQGESANAQVITADSKPDAKTEKNERVLQGRTILSRLLFVVFGATFGFLLSRAGATTYDFYPKLFLFQDAQLFLVIAVAAGLGLVGTLVYRLTKAKSIIGRQPLNFKGKPWLKTLIPGSLIFGIGWGLAGACPGTALSMLGEGKLGSIATIIGFLVGTWIYGFFAGRSATKAGK